MIDTPAGYIILTAVILIGIMLMAWPVDNTDMGEAN